MGMTQIEYAEHLGVSRSTVQRREKLAAMQKAAEGLEDGEAVLADVLADKKLLRDLKQARANIRRGLAAKKAGALRPEAWQVLCQITEEMAEMWQEEMAAYDAA